MKRHRSEVVLASLLLSMGVLPSAAQQITGTPGSPHATTTISGKQLPPARSTSLPSPSNRRS